MIFETDDVVSPMQQVAEQEINTGTILISGFPGVGKSCYYRNSGRYISDSDSSLFDKVKFPEIP